MTNKKAKSGVSKEFNFKLGADFSYGTTDGNESETSFITFTAPTSKNRKECMFLKQSFFRALNSIPSSNKSAGDAVEANKEFDGSDIITLFAMSSADLHEVCEVARKIFISGVGKMGGDGKLTGNLLDNIEDKLSTEVIQEMVGEYLVNFILRSSLNKLKNS